jgi:hypothetical protein
MKDGIGESINGGIDRLAAQVDGQTSAVARNAARVISVAVRLLRWPSLALLCAPIPMELALLGLSLHAHGWARVVGLILVALMATVSTAFGVRRHRILRAVAEPDALGTELGIAVSLSDRVDDARDVLTDVASGGGWRMFDRLRGLWRGISTTARWIESVADLPRARYFVPPKIGTTVTLTLGAAWLIPASVILTVVAVIGTVARAL